jgi:hypothetical protein
MVKMPKSSPDAVPGLSSESIDRVSRIHFVLGTKVLGSLVPELLLRRSPLPVLTPCYASLHGVSTVSQIGGNAY